MACGNPAIYALDTADVVAVRLARVPIEIATSEENVSMCIVASLQKLSGNE